MRHAYNENWFEYLISIIEKVFDTSNEKYIAQSYYKEKDLCMR